MSTIPDDLRTWAEIDLGALRHNLRHARQLIGGDTGILAVVKANAYGHGAAKIVPALAPDTAIFGVANLAEADEIDPIRHGRDVMLLSPCLPSERQSAIRRGYIVTVSSADEATAYASLGNPLINFKIDTGMGRIGCWHEFAHQELTRTAAVKGVTIHSISTHLPSADEDADFTDAQLSTFWKSTADFRKTAPAAKFHVLNSAGVLTRPERAGDVVRLGLVLYGASPLPAMQKSLRPVLTWKSRVVLVRDLPAGTGVSYGRTFITTRPMRTAVIAVGYADGFPRHASGQGAEVLIHGIRCPIIGRVTMDQIVVDATSLPSLSSGDVATLIGADGDGEIPVSELADCSGTIAWDIFTGIGKRVARFYKDSQPI